MEDLIFAHGLDLLSLSTPTSDEYPQLFQSEHAIDILKNLEKDRKGEQDFCDVVIRTENRNFSAHKCVVAAAAPFFHRMFSSKMKESYESKATITTISPEIMEVILDFIYTCTLNINDDNVYEILCAADYLQMQNIKDFCSFYLRESTSEDNWCVVWKFAKLYNMKNLIACTELFIVANFKTLLERDEMKQLSANLLLDFLGLRDESVQEIAIFNAVIAWVHHDTFYRMEHLPKIFAFIKLEKLSKDVLKNVVSKEEIIYKSPACAKLLVEAICSRMEVEKKVQQEILIIGGTPIEKDVLKVDVNSQEVIKFSSMPECRSGAGAVVVQETLYVMGGNSYNENVSNSYCSVISLNLKGDPSGWMEEPPLLNRRRCAGCVALNGYIYMCGGRAHNSMWLSSCERFHVTNQAWFAISEMNYKRAEFCLVALNDLLYSIGGSNRPHSSLDTVECFNPIVGTWTMVNPMISARSKFAAVVKDEEIYVMGGESDFNYLNNVEKFSMKTGLWISIASLSDSRYNHAACVVGGEIFVVGGNNKLEFYDATAREWKTKFSIERKLGCAVVPLGT